MDIGRALEIETIADEIKPFVALLSSRQKRDESEFPGATHFENHYKLDTHPGLGEVCATFMIGKDVPPGMCREECLLDLYRESLHKVLWFYATKVYENRHKEDK